MAIPKKQPLSPPAEPLRSVTADPVEPDPDAVPVVVAQGSWWHRIGGGSLTISIVLHSILLVIALLIVFTMTTPEKEKIEFLPGGGGGGKGSTDKLVQKRRAATMSAPKTRIVSIATDASVTLPDISTSMSDFSSLSVAAPMGGGMGGGSGGLRGSGSGGMMGNGRGSGIGPGFGQGFISLPLFGQKIDARRMAVVLDVSASMYPFLPIVIKEVDKVAPGSPVILHFGCGLGAAEIQNPGVEPTTSKDFDQDRIVTSLLSSGTRAMNQQEREALLATLKKRPKTYYVPSSGVGSTWVGLMDNKLKDADAIYWFADFADALTKDRIEEVARKMKTRRQKLYIHPSNPKWLIAGDPLAVNVARVEEELVTPSGGKVIKADVKKEEAVKQDKPKPKPAA